MRRTTVQKVAAWICLAVYALTGAIAGKHVVVLCVGPNGHLEVEVAGGSPCGDCGIECWPESDPDPRLGITSAAPSQCPCVDIPITLGNSGPQAQAPNNDSLKHITLAFNAPVETFRLAPAVRSETLFARERTPVPQICHLRTVVLLV